VQHRDRHITCISHCIAATVLRLGIIEHVLDFHSRVFRIIFQRKNLALVGVHLTYAESITIVVTATTANHVGEGFGEKERVRIDQNIARCLVFSRNGQDREYRSGNIFVRRPGNRIVRVEIVSRVLANKLDFVESALDGENKLITIRSRECTGINHAIHGVLEVDKFLVDLIACDQHFGRTRLGVSE